MNLKNKLDDFRTLENGWDGYNGNKITETTLIVTELYLKNEFNSEDYLRIHIYPMSNGGIQIEYSLNNFNVEIEILDYDITIHRYNHDVYSFKNINYKNQVRKQKIQKLLDGNN